VPGALVTRRCAESFKYFKRADIAGEAMLCALNKVLELEGLVLKRIEVGAAF
jgi:cobalamin biosynthesis protein CbiG